MAKSLVGIELNEINALIADTDGAAVCEKMPANLIDANGVVSPESLAEFLKKLKKNYRLGKDCAFVLPESSTFFRTVESPAVTEEQLKLNLPFEFRDFVGSDSINYNYDYIVDSVETDDEDNPKTLHLLAAAAHKDTVNEYASIFKKAGFKLKLALPNEMCVINIMNEAAQDNKECCFVGVGYNYTRVYIFNGKNLVADKSIEIGNHDIDKLIADNLNIDEYLAASVRENNQNGILSSVFLNTVYEKIALEVMKTINFYKYEYNNSELNTLYFYGLGAKNETLNNTICDYTEFKKGDISEILPDKFDDERVLISIGLIL